MIFQHIFIPKLTNKLFPSQLKNCNSGLTGTKQLTRQHTHTQKHTNTAAYYCSTRELNCLQDTLESLMTQGVYVCVCGCVNCFLYLHFTCTQFSCVSVSSPVTALHQRVTFLTSRAYVRVWVHVMCVWMCVCLCVWINKAIPVIS